MMEILGLILIALVGIGIYVFLKKEDEDNHSPAPVAKPEQAPLVTVPTVTLAPPPYPALEAKDVKEELAKVISQIAETKQSPAIVENIVFTNSGLADTVTVPVVTPAEKVTPKPKAAPVAKKVTTPKPKKKK
jgi:hypothetical protein